MTTVHLNNWALHVSLSSDPFVAPELANSFLSGNVFNHPYHEDDTFIYTSPIQTTNYSSQFVETINTTYDLGDPCPDYVAYCEKIGQDPWRIFKEEEIK